MGKKRKKRQSVYFVREMPDYFQIHEKIVKPRLGTMTDPDTKGKVNLYVNDVTFEIFRSGDTKVLVSYYDKENCEVVIKKIEELGVGKDWTFLEDVLTARDYKEALQEAKETVERLVEKLEKTEALTKGKYFMKLSRMIEDLVNKLNSMEEKFGYRAEIDDLRNRLDEVVKEVEVKRGISPAVSYATIVADYRAFLEQRLRKLIINKFGDKWLERVPSSVRGQVYAWKRKAINDGTATLETPEIEFLSFAGLADVFERCWNVLRKCYGDNPSGRYVKMLRELNPIRGVESHSREVILKNLVKFEYYGFELLCTEEDKQEFTKKVEYWRSRLPSEFKDVTKELAKLREELVKFWEKENVLKRLINEIGGELLEERLFSPASQEEIFDFYCGAPLSWKIIAADGDIKRDQEKEIIEKALGGSYNFQIICIVAEPGAGKTTVAWRVAYELFRQGRLCIHFYNDNPDLWYRLHQLYELIGHPFLILIDDIFRNREFVTALQNITKDDLPVTVLATSRSAEYQETRLKGFVKKIELKLSAKEKNALLKRLGKSYEELSPDIQSTYDETNLFLVLGMVLTKGKAFDEIIRDVIQKLFDWNKEYHDALSVAYEYVCFSHSYGLSIPEGLLSNLDKEGRFHGILEKERARGVFYEDTRLKYRARYIRTGAELIAVKALKLYSSAFSGRSADTLYREILEAANENEWEHRRYVAYLTRAILHEGDLKKMRGIIANNQKISYILHHATISELNIWKLIFNRLNLREESRRCAKRMLFRDPENTQDCQILVSELVGKELEGEAFSVMEKWLAQNPEDKVVFERYLALIREKGKSERLMRVIENTFTWLKKHPDDNKIRGIFLTLIRDRGFLETRHIKNALEDAENYLRRYGPYPLFPIYLTLVRKIKKAEINVKVDKKFVSDMGYQFINSCKWQDKIKQIADFAAWLCEIGSYGEAEEIYKKLIPISQTRGKIMSAYVYFGYGMLYLSQCFTLNLEESERLKKLNIAEEKFRNALENLKGHIARAFLGIVLWEQKRVEESQREFKHAEWWARYYRERISTLPDNLRDFAYLPGKLFYELGKFYLKFERYREARFWFRKAKEEEPDNFANWWRLASANIGLALAAEKRGRHLRARNLFSTALLQLKNALEKAPKPLQLPASIDIQAKIEECEKHLEKFKRSDQLLIRAFKSRGGSIISRSVDGRIILFDNRDPKSSFIKPGDVVKVRVVREDETYLIVRVIKKCSQN